MAFLATFCLFIGGSWTGTYDADIRRLTLVLVAVGLGGWLIVAVRDPWWRPQTKLWPGFAAALGVMAITTIMSPFPRLGVEYLAWAVILTCLYLILQRLMASSFFSRRILAFATLCAFIIGIAFVGQILLNWIEWWGLFGRVSAPPLRPGFASLTFGNPSAVMTASVLLTADRRRLPGRRLATADRARHRGRRALPRRDPAERIARRLARPGIGRHADAESSGWCRPPTVDGLRGSRGRGPRGWSCCRSWSGRSPSPWSRVQGSSSAQPPVETPTGRRTTRPRSGCSKSSPAVGLGPGSWAALRTSFTAAPDPDYYIPHAHNIYLQTLAEFGILGLAAGLVVVLLVLRLLYGAVRDPDPVRRRFGWCALFATIYFAGHQLLDFYANAPSILFAFAIPIAWLDATAAPSSPGTTLCRALGRATPSGSRSADRRRRCIAIVVVIGFLVWSETRATTMKEGGATWTAVTSQLASPR